jgi:hypothetical protein
VVYLFERARPRIAHPGQKQTPRRPSRGVLRCTETTVALAGYFFFAGFFLVVFLVVFFVAMSSPPFFG